MASGSNWLSGVNVVLVMAYGSLVRRFPHPIPAVASDPNMLGMWGVRIVGTFLCTQLWHYGLVSAWGCMIGHNLLLFALFLVYYLRGKWNPLRQR